MFPGSPNLRVSAIYYFLAAIFILLFAFDTYYLLPLMVSRLDHINSLWPDDAYGVILRNWSNIGRGNGLLHDGMHQAITWTSVE